MALSAQAGSGTSASGLLGCSGDTSTCQEWKLPWGGAQTLWRGDTDTQVIPRPSPGPRVGVGLSHHLHIHTTSFPPGGVSIPDFCLCCYNRVPQIGDYFSFKVLFGLMVLEARKATIRRVGGMQRVEGRQANLALKQPVLKVGRGPARAQEHWAGRFPCSWPPFYI